MSTQQPTLFSAATASLIIKRGTQFLATHEDERGCEYVIVSGFRLWTSHGIMQSEDAVQVHVDGRGNIYVMTTWEVRKALSENMCREYTLYGRVAGVSGATGLGYIVPQHFITCRREFATGEPLPPQKNSTTVVLGAASERLVNKYRARVDGCCFAVLGECSEKFVDFAAPRFSNTDCGHRNAPDGGARAYREVKTDYRADETGNFYFEFAERNPQKLHT